MSARISVQSENVAAPGRRIAEDVRNGNPVSKDDVQAVRREARELLRLADGALLSSEGCEDVDREELAGRVHSTGTDVHEAALHLDDVVLNEKDIEPEDIEMVRGYTERLEEAVDDVAQQLQN